MKLEFEAEEGIGVDRRGKHWKRAWISADALGDGRIPTLPEWSVLVRG